MWCVDIIPRVVLQRCHCCSIATAAALPLPSKTDAVLRLSWSFLQAFETRTVAAAAVVKAVDILEAGIEWGHLDALLEEAAHCQDIEESTSLRVQQVTVAEQNMVELLGSLPALHLLRLHMVQFATMYGLPPFMAAGWLESKTHLQWRLSSCCIKWHLRLLQEALPIAELRLSDLYCPAA